MLNEVKNLARRGCEILHFVQHDSGLQHRSTLIDRPTTIVRLNYMEQQLYTLAPVVSQHDHLFKNSTHAGQMESIQLAII
jgi:hypothetical protein